MITNRPKYLLDQPDYSVRPSLPIGLDLTSVPELVKVGMLFLGGVQPITSAMSEAAGYVLEDRPSEGELELYRRNCTRFQTVMVVASIASFREVDGVAQAVPYAISLIPANKRGTVLSEVGVDFVRQIDLNTFLQQQEPCCVGFDPFQGEWSAFGSISLFLDDKPTAGFADELGLITDMYFLQLGFDPDQVLMHDLGILDERARQKFHRHRTRLMFSPFRRIEARRVWGAESPIELFLIQALFGRGISPMLQMLLFDDGSAHPSLYDFWNSGVAELPNLITEADMYFPDRRVAVFCDSTKHHRGQRASAKDTVISDRLAAVGIRAVRIPGRLIVRDLSRAADIVCEALT